MDIKTLFPVILRAYDPAWPQWFAEEKARLEQLIGGEHIARISHYGSTAVPGLLAKPTVDILLEIHPGIDMGKLKTALPHPEYIRMTDEDRADVPPERLMFVKGYTERGFAEKVYHIHVRYAGEWDELLFRDYLIAYPETAAEYAALKRSLLVKFEYDRDGYTAAKGAFIREYTARARQVNKERKKQ